jgi:hypothetical protein
MSDKDARWVLDKTMVSNGQTAQKGTRHIKLSFSQTILDPAGLDGVDGDDVDGVVDFAFRSASVSVLT